jgi:hypothetical protein
MTSPLPLPDWVPWWVHLAIILVVLLFGLLFLLMPFSVFGTKARLEGIEARLDEIQGEIRSLAMRLPELAYEDDSDEDGRYARPPIPPRRAEPRIVRPPGRTEPRLY